MQIILCYKIPIPHPVIEIPDTSVIEDILWHVLYGITYNSLIMNLDSIMQLLLYKICIPRPIIEIPYSSVIKLFQACVIWYHL